jgi:hypothetical protein
MKYYLLGVSKNKKAQNGINIGDYIQALAASQFLPRVDGFLDRDEDLKDYSGEKAKIIMNGWFMHAPLNWPPSQDIEPLFVGFHLNPLAQKELTSKESIEYFKAHEPVGCRDQRTADVLTSSGVEAYFSGCLTLTLGRTFPRMSGNGKVYFVDPNVSQKKKDIVSLSSLSLYFAANLRACLKLYRNKNLFHGFGWKRRILLISRFLHDYSKVFSKETLLNATYITQQSRHYKDDFRTDEERLEEAGRLVDAYSKASLVVTSRIHCALPCLGIGTPVIYTKLEGDRFVNTSRLDGLENLLNVINCTEKGLIPQFETKLPMTATDHPQNSSKFKPLAEKLVRRCEDFIEEDRAQGNVR